MEYNISRKLAFIFLILVFLAPVCLFGQVDTDSSKAPTRDELEGKLRKAIEYVEAGKYEEAICEYKKLLSVGLEDGMVYLAIATNYTALSVQQFEEDSHSKAYKDSAKEAEEDFQKSIELYPSQKMQMSIWDFKVLVYKRLINMYCSIQLTEKADSWIEELRQIDFRIARELKAKCEGSKKEEPKK